jgi:hypothetical protein
MAAFAGGAYSGYHLVFNYRTERLITDCSLVDHELDMYALSHAKDIPSTGKKYPQTLLEIGVVQNKDAFFAKNVNLEEFTYTIKPGKGYELGVHLPDGTYYTSPQSYK